MAKRDQKFRGKSDAVIDEWLDHNQERAGKVHSNKKGKTKKVNPYTSEFLPLSDSNGTVVEVHPGVCRVKYDATQETLLCNYRRASVHKDTGDGGRARSPVAIGDRVKATRTGSRDGIIEGLCVRKNILSRPAPGRDEVIIHTIAANVDRLVIVASVQEPEFSPGLVDRFWITAQKQAIPAILVINKIDLLDQRQPWSIYENLPGIDVFCLSAKKHQNIDALARELSGQTVVFCGHSGVGKSSLLNALTEQESQRVGQVNDFTKKGRHTTTTSTVIDGPYGSRLMDTPGIRSFGLVGITPESLKDFYPEFATLECAARGCLHHLGEPDCQAGTFARHETYLRILDSLENGDPREGLD